MTFWQQFVIIRLPRWPLHVCKPGLSIQAASEASCGDARCRLAASRLPSGQLENGVQHVDIHERARDRNCGSAWTCACCALSAPAFAGAAEPHTGAQYPTGTRLRSGDLVRVISRAGPSAPTDGQFAGFKATIAARSTLNGAFAPRRRCRPVRLKNRGADHSANELR